jgi:3-deoxy-D-manno-octulosonate 8-phosphate phosphatase (KDO 8-P phosphatase)
MKIEPNIEERMREITMLMTDVDGVLTDGKIVFLGASDEAKVYNVKDGFGFKLWHRVGHLSAWVTARVSSAASKRAKELGITEYREAAPNKAIAVNEIAQKWGLKKEQIAFVGDDLPDLSAMKCAGLAVTVADAVEEVKEGADLVLDRRGGNAAIRLLIESILKAQGHWEQVTDKVASGL